MVRLRPNETIGNKLLMVKLVKLMWKDAEERAKLLGVMSASTKKQLFKKLNLQFRGVLIAWDEGVMGDDLVLVSTVWRNLFECRVDANLEDIELMVKYVRMNMQHLENMDLNEVKEHGMIDWLPLYPVIPLSKTTYTEKLTDGR